MLELKGLGDTVEQYKKFELETTLGENLVVVLRSPSGIDETIEYNRDINALQEHYDEDSSYDDQDRFKAMILHLHKWMNILSNNEEYSVNDILTSYKITALQYQRNMLYDILSQLTGNVGVKIEEGEDDTLIPFSLVEL